jgi:hypothetical protein
VLKVLAPALEPLIASPPQTSPDAVQVIAKADRKVQ